MGFPVDPYQYTLKKTVNCCGVGLHSGRTVNLSIKPAPVNNGIRFFRSDLVEGKHIKAHMDKVIDTRLATTIGDNDIIVSTTEHLMAALRSYGVDNANIELDAAEVPIMDGSAGPFIHLLKKSGLKKQDGLRKVLRITKKITYADGDKTISITPYDGFKVTGEICFDDTLIQSQKYSLNVNSDRFIKEISRARTFGYVEQVEELWANGYALGGTLENVIAIHWNRKSILNEDGLRFDDEFIRHKVLDLIGDLALLGCQVLGHVTAYKTGHTQHLAFMKAIADAPECWELIELKKNGTHSVLDRVVSSTRAAGDMIMPFFKPQPQAVAVPQTVY
jgi:UDP-3-O-[3-hydroxymyristoyl] N-acetylglucosamine deacetylase